MHKLHRKIQLPWQDDEPEIGKRLQDFYEMAVDRAMSTIHAASTVAMIVAVISGVLGIGAIVLVVVLAMRYRRNRRISGMLVSYDKYGDWARIRLPDGTEIKAHCTVADLSEGAPVVVALTHHGARVIEPGVSRRDMVKVYEMESAADM